EIYVIMKWIYWEMPRTFYQRGNWCVCKSVSTPRAITVSGDRTSGTCSVGRPSPLWNCGTL
ncbi:hypothetical protein K1T71_010051, partial [Dendrolimus kikuchii]